MKMRFVSRETLHDLEHFWFQRTPAQLQYRFPQEFCVWIRNALQIFSDGPRPFVTPHTYGTG